MEGVVAVDVVLDAVDIDVVVEDVLVVQGEVVVEGVDVDDVLLHVERENCFSSENATCKMNWFCVPTKCLSNVFSGLSMLINT